MKHAVIAGQIEGHYLAGHDLPPGRPDANLDRPDRELRRLAGIDHRLRLVTPSVPRVWRSRGRRACSGGVIAGASPAERSRTSDADSFRSLLSASVTTGAASRPGVDSDPDVDSQGEVRAHRHGGCC